MVSYQDETYFERLKILPEKCNLIFQEGRVSVTEYWDINPSRKFQGTSEDKKHCFLELFRNSVKLHMRSDVTVSGSLSGGLDSSSITSIISMDQPHVRFKTFTIYYEGQDQMDERRWVGEVVKAYPNVEPIYYSPSDDEVAACFDHAMKMHDVPFVWSPAISYYFLMKLVRQQGIKVIMDGQGADEYLAGYLPYFSNQPLEEHARKAGSLARCDGTSLYAFPSSRAEMESPRMDLRHLLASSRAALITEYMSNCSLLGLDYGMQFVQKHTGGTPLKQYLYGSMFTVPLPLLLQNTDRMSMAFSIECRVPFLDHRLVEFVYSLEDEDIVAEGRSKLILRTSLQHVLPKSIADRKDKQAFRGAEVVKWLRGPLKCLTESHFDFDRLSILNAGKVKDLMQRFKNGDNSKWELIWKLVALNRWVSI
jgi:asparagine synthase (glutamine-hydrolysing)